MVGRAIASIVDHAFGPWPGQLQPPGTLDAAPASWYRPPVPPIGIPIAQESP